jgi:hypothetical protein
MVEFRRNKVGEMMHAICSPGSCRDWGQLAISSCLQEKRSCEDMCSTNPTYSKGIYVFRCTFVRMCSYDGINSDWTVSVGTIL